MWVSVSCACSIVDKTKGQGKTVTENNVREYASTHVAIPSHELCQHERTYHGQPSEGIERAQSRENTGKTSNKEDVHDVCQARGWFT